MKGRICAPTEAPVESVNDATGAVYPNRIYNNSDSKTKSGIYAEVRRTSTGRSASVAAFDDVFGSIEIYKDVDRGPVVRMLPLDAATANFCKIPVLGGSAAATFTKTTGSYGDEYVYTPTQFLWTITGAIVVHQGAGNAIFSVARVYVTNGTIHVLPAVISGQTLPSAASFWYSVW